MKETPALKVLEIMGEQTLCHDDKLVLRALKSRPRRPGARGPRGGVGLAEDAWSMIERAVNEKGQLVITGYFNPETRENHGPDWPAREPEKYDPKVWRPSYLRRRELAEGVYFQTRNNEAELVIVNLYQDLTSRYRIALKQLLELEDAGILKYSPTAAPSDKNRLEALRQRLKDHFKPAVYEHNVLIKGDLGRELFDALRRAAEGREGSHVEEGTVYLDGWPRNRRALRNIKCYSIGAREGQPSLELYKLETTFQTQYFKARGILINNILEQPEVQERMRADLVRAIQEVEELLTEGGGMQALRAIQRSLGLEGEPRPGWIANELLNPARTLTERVRALEVGQARLAAEIEAMKRRQAAEQARQAAEQARLAAEQAHLKDEVRQLKK